MALLWLFAKCIAQNLLFMPLFLSAAFWFQRCNHARGRRGFYWLWSSMWPGGNVTFLFSVHGFYHNKYVIIIQTTVIYIRVYIIWSALLGPTRKAREDVGDSCEAVQVCIHLICYFLFFKDQLCFISMSDRTPSWIFLVVVLFKYVRILKFLVDKFHVKGHIEPACLAPTGEESCKSEYHYMGEQFRSIRKANSNICEQSFREVYNPCFLCI